MELKNMFNNINSKKSLLILICLGILIIATSFAYFAVMIANPALTDVTLGSEVSEKLIFTPGNTLSINANQGNLGEGNSSLSSQTMSSAQLIAASDSNSASAKYQVFFYIKSNDFEYSVNENLPEILLQVTDPEGNLITNLDGINYKTVTDSSGQTISGFDLTDKNCLLTIATDYVIDTTDSKDGTTQKWSINLIFVNLNSNQSANEGKNFEAELILQQEKTISYDIDGNPVGLSAKDIILLNNGGSSIIESKGMPDFSDITPSLYSGVDDDGNAYYFSGEVDNNWVLFAGFYWRILRINGDDSVRLIYSGKTPPTESEKSIQTGDNIVVNMNVEFNEFFEIHWDYTLLSFDFYENGNFASSVNSWYQNNLIAYESNIHLTDFCLGTSSTSVYAYGYWPADSFFEVNENPDAGDPYVKLFFSDEIIIDSFELGSYDPGYPSEVSYACEYDGIYTNRIATLSSREAYFAGVSSTSYLEGYSYTTLSPMSIQLDGFSNSSIESDELYIKTISSSGNFSSKTYNNLPTNDNLNVRPVISLTPDTSFSGSGNWNDPYIIDESMKLCEI